MASGTTRYPILVDIDALIAVGNSSLWLPITEYIGLTTTNVCKLEPEDWTGYSAVKAAWEGIPIDCTDILDDHRLP